MNRRRGLTILGYLLLAAGFLFLGQGAGYIRWPAESFMIEENRWVYGGGVIAFLGLALIVYARPRNR